MKASRLLSLLLVLQARRRMSTGELAERFEVSRRTVLRDVEALSAAGVPVYAERGRHGGIVLLPGTRLNASHLEPGEIDALSLSGLDRTRLAQLGLAAAAERASDKLAARRAGTVSADAAALSELIIADNAAWLAPAEKVDIAELAMELCSRRRVRLRYRRSGADRATPIVVDPYGLALKSGRWYLVADTDGAPRLFALERLDAYETLPAPALLRDGHTLATVWAELKAMIETPGRVTIDARLRRSRLDLARRVLGARISAVEPLDDRWCRLSIGYDEVEAVRQLLQFGDHIEIVSPESARRRIRELAADLLERHAPSSAGPE